MRDGRVALVILAAGIAPALIKRSKPLAKYVGDQLIRAGEYLKVGTDEKVEVAQEDPLAAEEVAGQVVAEEIGDGAASEPITPEPKQEKKSGHGDQTKKPKRD
jgi:hypothetical protein